jgi:hypothetical protein
MWDESGLDQDAGPADFVFGGSEERLGQEENYFFADEGTLPVGTADLSISQAGVGTVMMLLKHGSRGHLTSIHADMSALPLSIPIDD